MIRKCFVCGQTIRKNRIPIADCYSYVTLHKGKPLHSYCKILIDVFDPIDQKSIIDELHVAKQESRGWRFIVSQIHLKYAGLQAIWDYPDIEEFELV